MPPACAPLALEARRMCAVATRDAALAVLVSDRSGLGPPDLLWLELRPTDAPPAEPPHTAYCHVLGGDVSGPAALAATFAATCAALAYEGKDESKLASAITSALPTSVARVVAPLVRKLADASVAATAGAPPRWDVTKGLYCTFDAFSRVDVRVSFHVPGGMETFAVDETGEAVDVDGALWQGVHVSAFLRATAPPLAVVSHVGSTRVLAPPPATPAEERALLAHVQMLYEEDWCGSLPELLPLPGEADSDSNAVICSRILALFVSKQRLPQAHAFFKELARHHPDAIVFAAQASEAMNVDPLTDLEEAHDRLAAEGRNPGPLLTVALCHACLEAIIVKADAKGKAKAPRRSVTEVLQLAQGAVQAYPTRHDVWILLARTYVVMGMHARALVALNLMPAPPDDADDVAGVYVRLPPRVADDDDDDDDDDMRIVPPRGAEAYDASSVEAQRVLAEETQSGLQRLTELPSAILLPLGSPAVVGAYGSTHGGLEAAALGRVPPEEALRMQVYRIIIDMVNDLTWDGFLELRGGVFVMSDELEDELGISSEDEEGEDEEEGEEDEGAVEQGVEEERAEEEPYDEGSGGEDIAADGAAEQSGPVAESSVRCAPSLRTLHGQLAGPVVEASEGASSLRNLLPAKQNAERKPMVCEVWLDELIQGLYEDLSEYMEFRRLDKIVERKATRAHSADGVASAASSAVPDMERLPFHEYEGPDWMRLGMLCERLGRPEDAERCYRTCMTTSEPAVNMTSTLALLRLYAHTFGWPRELVGCAMKLAEFHGAEHAAESTNLVSGLAAGVAKCGLQSVRDAVGASAGAKETRVVLDGLLHEMVRWQTVGFDA